MYFSISKVKMNYIYIYMYVTGYHTGYVYVLESVLLIWLPIHKLI